MNVEDVLRTQFQASAPTIPLRPLQRDVLLRRARRHRSARRGVLAVGVAASLGIGVVAVSSVWPETPKGDQIVRPVGPSTSLSSREALALAERFVGRLVEDDVDGSWDLLTPATQARVGSRAEWEDSMRFLRSTIGWIAASDVEATVTSLETGLGERHVATYTAPVDGSSALLEPIVVEIVAGAPRFDLPSPTLDYTISIEPEVPELFACSVPACDPRSVWPEITDGTTFSSLLTPAEGVRDVWFSVGGNAWVARGDVSEAGDALRAQATFDGTDVQGGVLVYLVTIETKDGLLETYGYRVTFDGS